MTFVNLPKKVKLSRALSRDWLRPALEHPHVVENGTGRWLVASDGYMVVRHPAPDLPLGPLHAEALARIERGHAHEVLDDGTVRIGEVDYRRPQVKHLGEKTAALKFTVRKGQKAIKICLNPEFLKRAADALDGDAKTYGVILEIAVENGTTLSPIRVTSPRGGDAEALLMPIRIPTETGPDA